MCESKTLSLFPPCLVLGCVLSSLRPPERAPQQPQQRNIISQFSLLLRLILRAHVNAHQLRQGFRLRLPLHFRFKVILGFSDGKHSPKARDDEHHQHQPASVFPVGFPRRGIRGVDDPVEDEDE